MWFIGELVWLFVAGFHLALYARRHPGSRIDRMFSYLERV